MLVPMRDELTTSAWGRLLRLGSLATRVGVSLATEQALALLRAEPIQQARRTENFVLNAVRVTEALGQLKGAAMKAGQMLSVHEGLLPPEVLAVLRRLQNEAPPVPFRTMQHTLRRELPDFERSFEHLDPTPIAAASIGQVYRGRLRDGRQVAVKIQYPDIDRVVRSDLKNLKKLFGSLLAMVADVDFESIWEELRDRLLEELDYVHEAANLRRMAALHAEARNIVVPGVIDEASTARVLTMDYVPGRSPDVASDRAIPEEMRNAWGATLLTFTLRGLIEHRFLHADPNLANFAFLDDGRVIVYDHGCVKAVDESLARGYARLLRGLLEADLQALPRLLHAMGVRKRSTGSPLPRSLLDPIATLATSMVGAAPYRFSRETEVYDLILQMKMRDFGAYSDVDLPADMTFVSRTLGGLFGNLCRLGAVGRWRDVVEPFAAPNASLSTSVNA